MAKGMTDETSRQNQNNLPDTQEPTLEMPRNAAEAAAAEALDAAREAISSVDDEQTRAAEADDLDNADSFPLPDFSTSNPGAIAGGIDLLSDVNLRVTIELGRTEMLVEDVLRLGEGSVVELDKLAGDPVDIYVNDRHVARGEVLVLNDNFCVRINEILAAPGIHTSKERKAG